MPPRGKKPKPSALKIHEGNRGHRPLNDDEPVVAPCADVPEPPAHLDAEAEAEWRRVAPMLVNVKVLTELDRCVMAGYCVAWSAFVQADTDVQKYGRMFVSTKTNKNGETTSTPYMSPYLAERAMAMKQMHTYATELGLSPSSRSRIHLDRDKDNDGFDDGSKDARTA